jgi:hypothetical protein
MINNILKKTGYGKHWTKDEIKNLIENYPDNRAIDFLDLLPGRQKFDR